MGTPNKQTQSMMISIGSAAVMAEMLIDQITGFGICGLQFEFWPDGRLVCNRAAVSQSLPSLLAGEGEGVLGCLRSSQVSKCMLKCCCKDTDSQSDDPSVSHLHCRRLCFS